MAHKESGGKRGFLIILGLTFESTGSAVQVFKTMARRTLQHKVGLQI